MNKKNNNKGFTLAELLIVVAIIAVLVAIAIPIFNSQLEKSREATDIANARDYYAEITTAIIDTSLSDTQTTMKVSGGLTATGTFNATTKKLEKVVVADTTVNQKVYSDWASGNPTIGGYKLVAADAPASASTTSIEYSFTEDTNGHTYLSGVAWKAPTP